MNITKGKTLATREITKGCALCISGKKLVLFITGLCNKACYYCTISRSRWQKDEVWANERKVEKPQDVIEEAKICRARGAGITGGEPLLKIERTLDYIRLLKKTFGSSFHIHLYTNGTLATPENLSALHEAGLDELRIHLNREAVKEALKFPNWKVGMEVPCIPGKEKELCELVDFLENQGAHFLNINEMEFSDRNVSPMEQAGLKLKPNSLTAVAGSAETAQKVLHYAEKRCKRLSVHFCTARLKLDYQLRNRLTNRARSIRKPFEKITKNGFLFKGVIEGGDLKTIAKNLKKLGVPEERIFINLKKNRVETSPEAAKIAARKLSFKASLVEEYPCANPWDWEKTPLN